MSLFAEEEQEPLLPEGARVSITERLVPSISFGLASLSGIVGALMTVRVFVSLRESRTPEWTRSSRH